jgi:hypothetical protein
MTRSQDTPRKAGPSLERPGFLLDSLVSRLGSRVYIPVSHRGPWQGVTTKAYQE